MTACKDRTRPRVRLYLEPLEKRELLNGSFEEFGVSPIARDMTRMNNDVETSTITLVNAAQSAPTNATPLASVHNR